MPKVHIPVMQSILVPSTALLLALATGAPAQVRKKLDPAHQKDLATLQPKIDSAIDRGVAWLLSTQQRDGSWGYEHKVFATGQTALAAYTLMKSGLPPTHSAVQRAIAHIKSQRATMVYAAGSQLMALGATHDPAHHEHMQTIVKDLLRWQDGNWSYPNPGGAITRLHSDLDLSITQFAVLGFRAALQAGLSLPPRALREAFGDILSYQEKPRRVKWQDPGSGSSSGQRDIAGYRYRWTVRNKSTGSMTTAGITAATVTAECLGKRLGRRKQKSLDDANAMAVAWLDHNYSVSRNPNDGQRWRYYYLYGLERVGSLLGTEYVGVHPWYLDGAKLLIKEQKPGGFWIQDGEEPDTCFALLFLKRATAPTTGKNQKVASLIKAEGKDSPVGMRCAVDPDGSTVNFWITRIGEVSNRSKEAASLRLMKVEYLLNGKVIASLDGKPGNGWRGEAHHHKYSFDERGKHKLSARVTTAVAADDGVWTADKIHEGLALNLEMDQVLEPWMLELAGDHDKNQLAETSLRVEASSQTSKHIAQNAVDQFEATSWRCTASDKQPKLSLTLSKSQRAHALWLTQANGKRLHRGELDRITRLAVRINKQKEAFEVDCPADEFEPIRISFDKQIRVKRIEIEILKRVRGSKQPGVAGFAELSLRAR